MADKQLDVRGLPCPMPVLKAKKALADMAMNATLEVLATDPGAPSDFEALCQALGHTLVESTAEGGTYRFLIRHAG